MSSLNLVGIDEAGRGAIAGSLVVASFLDCFNYPDFIKDSKKLSNKVREKIFNYFLEKNFIFGIGIVSNEFIDRYGISKAVKEGVYLSLNFIFGKNSFLFDESFFKNYNFKENYSLYYPEFKKIDGDFLFLIDGNLPIIKEYKTIAIINGDDRIPIISSASIIAKVVRDKIMINLSNKFNEYNFSINKGYCTDGHLKTLKVYGVSSVHRKTFLKNFLKMI